MEKEIVHIDAISIHLGLGMVKNIIIIQKVS